MPCPPQPKPCDPCWEKKIEWNPCVPCPPGPVGPVCSSYDLCWKTSDCQEAHATVLSDANLTLFNSALATVNTNVLNALEPAIAPNGWTAARAAALTAAISPLYDASSVNTFVTFVNPLNLGLPIPNPNRLAVVPGNVSFGTAEIVGSINALIGLLTGTTAPGTNVTLTLNRAASSITGQFVQCSRLATLKTVIVFTATSGTGPELRQQGTYTFEVGSTATLCDCGAKPIVISGNSAITYTAPPPVPQ